MLIVADDGGQVIANASQPASVASAETEAVTANLPHVNDLGRPVLNDLFAHRPSSGSVKLDIMQDGEKWHGLVSLIA